jgi:hypothetical protein
VIEQPHGLFSQQQQRQKIAGARVSFLEARPSEQSVFNSCGIKKPSNLSQQLQKLENIGQELLKSNRDTKTYLKAKNLE